MLDQLQEFAKNLSEEVLDVPRNTRDLVGGTIAMTIIDNSPLEGLINTAANAVPVSVEQKQTITTGMNYSVARVICRSGEKALGY